MFNKLGFRVSFRGSSFRIATRSIWIIIFYIIFQRLQISKFTNICMQENIFFDIAELNWKMNRTRMGKEKEKEGTIRKDITGR